MYYVLCIMYFVYKLIIYIVNMKLMLFPIFTTLLLVLPLPPLPQNITKHNIT